MRFTKLIAMAGAVSMLATVASFSVNAEEAKEDVIVVAAPEYRVVEEGKAVITNVVTDEVEFTIPAKIETEETVLEVIGVDDFAFSLCENLEVVNVPDSLTIANTGNVAFLTSSAVMNFLDGELGSTATTDDVVKYIAEKANYNDGNYTDADLADLSVKLNDKLSMVDVSVASTVEGKIMTLLKNVDKMGLSEKNINQFNLWIATVTYDGFTLCGNEGIEMQTYAAGREMLGMVYKAGASGKPGDANLDGRVNVRDAAFIAKALANDEVDNLPKNADFNGDNKINVRDAAAIASSLA